MEVRTERLLLRRWIEADVEPYAALCADPRVMRYIADGATLTHDAAAKQVEWFEQQWDRNGFGLWAAELADDGTFIGFAGLSQPLFLPEVLPAVEVGWRFAHDHWGQGLATESGRAALDYGFATVGLNRVIGIVNAENAASNRVMGKLGMSVDRDTVHPTADVAVRVWAIERGSSISQV